MRHVDGGDTAWFGKVVNFEAVPHDPAVWAVIVDAYYPTGNKLGKRVVESYYLAPNPNPGWGYTDAQGNFQEPALEPPEAEWEVTWPGETDPNAPLTRGPQPTRAPLPDGWSEVIVNNQTLYVDQRGAMLDPTITEDIPLEMFQNFFAVTKGYVDSKPPGWKLKPREDGDKGNLAYLAPDGTTWVVWIPGDDATHRPLNVSLIEDAYAYDDALKEVAAVEKQGVEQTKALAEVREELARIQETAKKSPYSETDEWQMLELYPDEPDHCAAKWYFESARRRLVYEELVDRFPDMYGLTDENTTKGRMQLATVKSSFFA